jgi:hypothetical protein
MYGCHTHPSVHPSIHPPIHPSIHPCHPYTTHSYHIAIVAALLLFPSPLPPTPFCLPACLPFSLHPKRLPLLLLLLLYFKYQSFAAAAAAAALFFSRRWTFCCENHYPLFSRFLQSIKF